MSSATAFAAIQRVLGPVLLGLGTIFQPKANIDDHWSKSPRVEIVVNAPADESGEPSEPHLEDAALTGQHCA